MRFLTRLWELFEKAVLATVRFLLKLIGKEMTEEQEKGFIQFVKFCLVGVSNTAVSLIVYYGFVLVNERLYIVGNTAGFILSVLNAYFWNSRFVFKKRDEKAKTIGKTFLAYSVNLLISTGILYLIVDILHISELIAPLINLVVTLPINYLLNKLWVMK